MISSSHGPRVALSKGMISFSLRIVVTPAKREELVSSVSRLLAPTRVQPDCLSARVYLDTEDEGAVTMVQEWASRSQLDRYLNSDAGKLLLAAMESSSVAPEIRFDTIQQSDGMEVFAQARLQHG
jgi:quinol monooxygenase YgiN